MGRSDNLTEEFTIAQRNLTAAIDAFAAVARKLEFRLNELERREREGGKDSKGEEHLKEEIGVQRDSAVQQAVEQFKEGTKVWREIERRVSEREVDAMVVEREEQAEDSITANRVVLNVGGRKFVTTRATIERYKGSYLANLTNSNNNNYDFTTQEYFIDRDWEYFGIILNFMRKGKLRNADLKVDVADLQEEFQFYNIPCSELNNISQELSLGNCWVETGNILSASHQQIIQEWLPNKKFQLLYKATRDGFQAMNFHRKCDLQGPTLTCIQSKGGFIFGGFSPEAWESSSTWRSKYNPATFLFTLVNPHAIPPTRYWLKDGERASISVSEGCCAYFGGEGDVYVNSDSHCTVSATNFPSSFVDSTGKGKTTFTGSYIYTTSEVEVYSVF